MSFNIVIKRYIKEARAEETRRIKVEGSKVNIGTGAGNEIQLEGVGVSIKHAIVEKSDDNTYWLNDLDTDGTYINNNLVSKRCQLSNQDEIKIGSYSLVTTIPNSPEEPATLLITQLAGKEEDTKSLAEKKIEEKIKYVSGYKLSTGLFTKARLSVLGVALLTGLSVFWIAGKDKTTLSPGVLSKAHTKFNNDCTRCHTVAWHTVLDKDCFECHRDKKIPHNENQIRTPNCTQCHFEHKGNPLLADIEDRFCTQCHSDLKVKGYIPSSTYETEILGFESGHPEFAVAVRLSEQNGKMVRVRLADNNNLKDNTPIKLNHKVHLKPNLRGPDGPENLRCENCHRVDASGEYTLPIEYERDCQRCHTLEFLDRFSKAKVVVSHEAPDIVRRFLQNYYREYAINNINRLGLGGNVNAVNQLVSSGVRDAEGVLFTKKQCDKCHTIKEIASGLYEVEKPKIPLRWLPHSRFDHELHVKNLRLKCSSCHEAEKSEMTTDVLMPSIDKCQECHSLEDGAKTECVLCHLYHQRKEMAAMEGTKSIKEIREGR